MTTERNPENTRQSILNAAFQALHINGYQGMRIDRVLLATGLKKGALYHHFSGKQALGYAVLEDIIEPHISGLWIEPLQQGGDPLSRIDELFLQLPDVWSDEFLFRGCPLNNLAQEMSPIDEGFRMRIADFFMVWQSAISDALQSGQQQGLVDTTVDTDASALFILSTIEGALGMTKNHRDKTVFYRCAKELKRYLEGLRPQ